MFRYRLFDQGKMKLKAFAKINLALDILGKDESTYHEIQTIFHEVPDLFDELEIMKSDHDQVICENIPEEENLAYKALKLLKQKFEIEKFIKIIINKNIPLSSGLGGGSSDAAATLKGLNQLWNLDLSPEQLMEIAAELGMDVPFFILGGTALGTHFGEKITPLPSLKHHFRIHPKSGQSQKTSSAYSSLDLSKCGQNLEKTKKLIAALQQEKFLPELIHNDFESISLIPKNHHLSGSGPTTFTI
jgi:4-diphosphocytidyl-2-C-methyl-D-erythritol kinase